MSIFNKLTRGVIAISALGSFAMPMTGCLDKEIEPTGDLTGQAKLEKGEQRGLRAEYYQYMGSNNGNNSLAFGSTARKITTQIVQSINYDRGNNNARPAPGVDPDFFSARYYGYFVPPTSGKYMLCTCGDDGVRMILDGESVISNAGFADQSARFWGTGAMDLEGGKRYPMRLDYFQGNGGANLQLYWVKNPATSDYNNHCYSTETDATTGAATKTFDCAGATDGVISPEVELVPPSAFIAAGNEIAEQVAACQNKPTYLPMDQAPNSSDPNVMKALRLFERLTGTNVPLFDSRIKAMAELIAKGKAKDASRIATQDNGFYDKVVRRFAARMSTRDEVPDAPLNDFSATVIGVVRDQVDARQLLIGNFLYRAKDILFWHDRSMSGRAKVLASNQHYIEIEGSGIPLACALDKLDRYDLSNLPAGFEQLGAIPDATVPNDQQTGAAPLPEPAGLLTSRGFAEAHMIAGTNRRPVQKAFEYFLCASLDTIRTSETPDIMVGRDVERFPNGPDSNQDFQNQCKSCHGNLDSLRPAFSEYHFENGIMKFAPFFAKNTRGINNNTENVTDMKLSPKNQEQGMNNAQGTWPVHWKLNHNVNYADGYFVKDSKFVNLFAATTIGSRYGWHETSGEGIREFGRMFAKTQAFPRCMAKRVYSEVCGADPMSQGFPPALSTWLDTVGDLFARNGYDLKDLFETIGPSCQ